MTQMNLEKHVSDEDIKIACAELGTALEIIYNSNIPREPVLLALLSTAGKLAHISDCPRTVFVKLAEGAFDSYASP